MGPDVLIDACRDAMVTSGWLMAPLLLVGLIVGLVMGMLQTITNIHDPTISLIPRILAVLLAAMAILPWFVTRVMEYSQSMFSQLPFTGGG